MSENGRLVDVFPDGERKFIQKLPLDTRNAWTKVKNPKNTGSSRLRMFARPNGSGKSTFKTMVRWKLLGIYLVNSGKNVSSQTCDIF